MPKYIITNCTVQDGNDVARNNASAFWEDVNWQYCWKDYTLDRLIGAFNLRTPRNLLLDQDTRRHFKAVDPETGKLVGYIRWKLPSGRTKAEDGNPVWPEGQTPDVSAEEFEKFERMAAQADWNPLEYQGEDDLDAVLTKTKDELLAKKEYLVLDHFAVHPESQRRGVGTALIQHGIQKAREMGIDIFLMAFVSGFKLYENAGFKLLDSIVQDATRLGGNDYYAVRFMELEVNKD